jgi:hypothetical protein
LKVQGWIKVPWFPFLEVQVTLEGNEDCYVNADSTAGKRNQDSAVCVIASMVSSNVPSLKHDRDD